jgi:hypothetical protein
MGWFIGDYVFAKRHNRELDKASAVDRIMAHVHLGGRRKRPSSIIPMRRDPPRCTPCRQQEAGVNKGSKRWER